MKTKAIMAVCGFILVFTGTILAGECGKYSQRADTRRATASQNTVVASILSKYNASSLTVEDARAINTAFREAGIRPGPAQKEAIAAAGFDPHQISTLDPPPDKPMRDDSSHQ